MSTITRRSVRRCAPTFEGTKIARGQPRPSWHTKAWTPHRADIAADSDDIFIMARAVDTLYRHKAVRKAQREARRASR